MEYVKVRGVKHFIFDTVREFEDYFLSMHGAVPKLVEDWKQGQEGDWVVADDGGVVQILKRTTYSKRTNSWVGYVRTIVGPFPLRKGQEMDTDPTLHPDRYSFSKKSRAQVRKDVRKRRTLTKKEKRLIALLFCGLDAKEAFVQAYGTELNWRRRMDDIMTRPAVINAITIRSQDVAKELGIDKEFVLKNLKQIIEKSKSDLVRLGALKEVGEIIHMKDDDEAPRMLEGGFKGFKQIEEAEVVKPEEEDVDG